MNEPTNRSKILAAKLNGLLDMGKCVVHSIEPSEKGDVAFRLNLTVGGRKTSIEVGWSLDEGDVYVNKKLISVVRP